MEEKAKKPTEKVGQFVSNSKTETQINTLLQSLALVEDVTDLEEVKLYTDFALVKNFLDGTIFEWERNDWVKSNDKPVSHADLWKELSNLVVEYNV